MITWDEREAVAQFLEQHVGQAEHPEKTQALAYRDADGVMVAALAYHHFNTLSCSCDIALLGRKFPRSLLLAGLWYPFEQLKVRRLTFFVAATNLRSIALVEKLGAFREATLQDGCSSGTAYIYCLLPDQCPIWSKFNVKRRKCPTSS